MTFAAGIGLGILILPALVAVVMLWLILSDHESAEKRESTC